MARGRFVWLHSTGNLRGFLWLIDPHIAISCHQAATVSAGICSRGVWLAWPMAWPFSQRAWGLTPGLAQPHLSTPSAQPGQTVSTVGPLHPSSWGAPGQAQWPAPFASLGQVDFSRLYQCVPHTADQDLGRHTQTPLLCSTVKFYLSHVYTQGAFPAGLFPEFQARGRARVPQPRSARIKWCDIPCLFGGFQGPERRDWSPGLSPLASPASLSSLPSNMSCKENGASLFPFSHMYLIPDTVLRTQPDARDSGTISALVSGPPPSPSVVNRKG